MPIDKTKLATPQQIAEWLQISLTRLKRYRRDGDGPRFIRDGRMIRYAWTDVHAWCDQRRTNGGNA